MTPHAMNQASHQPLAGSRLPTESEPDSERGCRCDLVENRRMGGARSDQSGVAGSGPHPFANFQQLGMQPRERLSDD